jgi:hypothetical protein
VAPRGPSRVFQAHGTDRRASPRNHRTSLTLACTPPAPPPVAAYSVQRLPLRGLRPPWGLSGRFHPRTSVHGNTNHVLGSPSKRRTSRGPAPRAPAANDRARRGRRLSWGFVPYNTFQPDRSGSPGTSWPRHLPSSGFDLPSRRFAPRQVWHRLVNRRSELGVRPPGPCSSRPAVPLSGPRLSCRFSAPDFSGAGATSEVDSSSGRGPKAAAEATTAEPCPPGFLPLQGFLLCHLGTGFPVRAPHAFPTGSAPYVSTSGRGPRGLSAAQLACLSQDCLPSWGFAPFRFERVS